MTQPMTKTLMKVMADSAAIENGVDIPPKSEGDFGVVTFALPTVVLVVVVDVVVIDVVVVVVVVLTGSNKLFPAAGLLEVRCGNKRDRRTTNIRISIDEKKDLKFEGDMTKKWGKIPTN